MSRALVLNASFEPLGVVPLRRAVVLVLKGRADIVEEEAERLVRSAARSMAAPLVVRLRTMVKVPYRATLPLTRRAVLARDQSTCAYCGKHGTSQSLSIDHVIPRSRGGAHAWTNVVTACKACNHRKDDRTPAEAGLVLRFKPYAPSGHMAIVVLVGTVEEAWAPYLGVAAA